MNSAPRSVSRRGAHRAEDESSGPAEPGVERSERRARAAIATFVMLGVALRLLTLPAVGFEADVAALVAWAERVATVGPGAFYEPGYHHSGYQPGILYVLGALGALLDGEALRLSLKALSIPADVAIVLVVSAFVRRRAGPAAGVTAAALWSFAPAAIFAGPYWGQLDSVGSLAFFGAVLAAGARRWALAGALAAAATMVKPQFGLAAIVIGTAAAFEGLRTRDGRPFARVAFAGFVTVVGLALPFRQDPFGLLGLVREAAELYPYTSLYAFNPWSVLLDFWKPDDAYLGIGATLLFAGVAASCAPLWWRRDTAMLLTAGALASAAFYFLPTRSHERYLFPAFVLLLPLAAMRARLLAPYIVLQLTFFLTLYFALSRYPQNGLWAPAWIEASLFSRPGQIALAIILIGGFAYVAWLLLRGEAQLTADGATAAALETLPAREPGTRWRLPSGLAPGFAPTRRDLVLALLVGLAVLASRGYRLDHPRDMYFDEVYHARTAYELLAQRDVYEWTHPHLAKELMALGILAFGSDRVAGREDVSKADPIVALAVTNDGTRVYALADGRVLLRDRGGQEVGRLDLGREPIRAVAIDGNRIFVATDRELIETDLALAAPVRSRFRWSASDREERALTALAAAGGLVAVGSGAGVEIRGAGPPLFVSTPAVALALRPDGTVLYLLDPQGTVHVVKTADGTEKSVHPAGGPVRAIAHALSSDRLFLARSDIPSLDVIELESGRRETVSLANARTGKVTEPASAVLVVPRTQFLHVLAGDALISVETHGSSAYASLAVSGQRLALDGTADEVLVGDSTGATRVATGRQALSWRIPGVIAGAMLAFFIVLLARRLFASHIAPALAGGIVLIDGSMFAQARIGMNDVYVAAFLAAGWYFVLAAHAPRRSARLDLVIAGLLFGLAAASKWVAFYALGGLGVLAVAATAYAYAKHRPGTGGPFDLLRGRGANAVFLFGCFVVLPFVVYLLAYVPWFGGPTAPYGWDLRELTQQMYWYHSGLTSPHPAGSPWWSWPLVLKPVYWYYGQSESGSAVIYNAGNIVLFWGALAAVIWCAIAAVRARSFTLGLVVFALAVQLVAWVPITRVLFFYHFFTALPWYFLALTAALVHLIEGGRRPLVAGYLALASVAFLFFYPFVSGQPVAADQTGIFFILPTWQYDCQFYPAFTCTLQGTQLSAAALAMRLGPPLALGAALVAAWLVLTRGGLRTVKGWATRRPPP